jgi:nucleoside-diphosphate-sugar epimerase
VTGGSGFIGAAIARSLLMQGHKVRVLDNNSRGRVSRISDIYKDIEFLEGDIRSEFQVSQALKGTDAVVHLAYINGTENFYLNPREVLEVGIEGMQNLVTGINANDISEFYLASTSEVYQKPRIFPTPEDIQLVVPDPFNPRYSYGLGKILQEFMTIHFLPKVEKRIIFRPHNIYGIDMGWQHVIPELFQKISACDQDGIFLKGDGTQLRSFCHIDDFVQGFNLLLSSKFSGTEVVNVGSPIETSILDLATLIAMTLGRDVIFHKGPLPSGETDRRVPDLSKLVAAGYSPKVSLGEGIANYREWFCKVK